MRDVQRFLVTAAKGALLFAIAALALALASASDLSFLYANF